MLQENKIIELLPQVLSGNRLIEELGYLPAYNETIIEQSQASRLLALSDIYRVYVPSEMSIEIYNKLYLALLLSIKKKFTAAAVKQRYENAKMIKRMDSVGIIGGSDSFTIIGSSGIGKSSAIEKSIGLLTENAIIQDDELIGNVIPCLVVQCPFDSSVKSLLLEILRKTDEVLETNYYESAKKSRYTTTDVLIGSVSTIALNHIGLLIVDEIQNVVNSKNGKSLIGSLTQLINNSGISICMVGTPESVPFFEQAMQLARRSVGLRYEAMEYGDYFKFLCQVLWQYQYVKECVELTEEVTYWLYEHCGGVVSILITLLHDSQEMAIMSGYDTLDLTILEETYKSRLSMLHGYIKPNMGAKASQKRKKRMPEISSEILCIENESLISDLSTIVKQGAMDIDEMINRMNVAFMVEVIAC